MPLSQIEELIQKNIQGGASSEEVILLSNWLKESEQNKLIYLQIKEYWNAEVTSTIPIDYKAVLSKTLQRIKKTGSISGKREALRTKYIKAATIVAACFAGIIIYLGFIKPPPTHFYSYMTGNSISEVVLPDGTHLSLNKNSVLTYKNDFGEDKRVVSLQGEAFFDVEKDPGIPFIVDLKDIKITVLGTSFNVRNNPQEEYISASLLRGAIQCETSNQRIFLKPDQKLEYNKLNREMRVEKTDLNPVIAWKEDLIRYKSKTLPEILRIIERQYNVTVTIKDGGLFDEQLTGAFDKKLSVEQILDLLKRHVSFNWEKRNDSYLITK